MNEPSAAERDAEHLRLLALFHWILSGIVALLSLLPLIHVTLGFLILAGRLGGHDRNAPPAIVGLLLMAAGATLILCGLSFAAGLAFAARNLSQRRAYTFCMVIAGLSCGFSPLGTVLGVFTILTLNRPSVRALFGRA